MLIFDKQRESYQIVGYKQFDSLEPLRATFLNNGQPISLIDYYVRFECKKPDGNIVIDDENINIRNVCEIEMLLNEQVAVVNGNVKCQFVLVRKNDERQTSTFDFEMNIQQSVIAINGYSHSTITIAERLNKDIPIAKKLHEDLTKDIADGNKTKQELIEKTTIAKTTINTLVEKTAEGNNTIDGLVEKDAIAKATDSKLNKTIDNANETNRILNESNSEADTTNARLQMTIDSGKDSIDKINATGNKSLIIGASQFINNEYTWKHDMNSEDLHVTFEDLATKLPLLPDYQRIDKNNILIRNSAESPNIKVVLSASYYQGNALFGTNVEEFASDSIGVNTKKVRLKDGNGIVENPVTDSDAVFMPDGTTKLTKKIDDISASLEQKAQQSELNSLKDIKADKNSVYNKNETYAKAEVDSKVFTMANMGQDVKTAMTGGSVAVVGVNAVDTINTKDNAITSPKRSVFGEWVGFNQPNGYKPSLNTSTKTWTFPLNSQLVWRDKSYNLGSSAIIVDYSGVSSVYIKIYYNIVSNTFECVSLGNIPADKENCLLVATGMSTGNNWSSLFPYDVAGITPILASNFESQPYITKVRTNEEANIMQHMNTDEWKVEETVTSNGSIYVFCQYIAIRISNITSKTYNWSDATHIKAQINDATRFITPPSGARADYLEIKAGEILCLNTETYNLEIVTVTNLRYPKYVVMALNWNGKLVKGTILENIISQNKRRIDGIDKEIINLKNNVSTLPQYVLDDINTVNSALTYEHGDNFKFAYMNDVHGQTQDYGYIKKLMDYGQVDLLCINGDINKSQSEQSLELTKEHFISQAEILRNIKDPVCVTRGNHDGVLGNTTFTDDLFTNVLIRPFIKENLNSKGYYYKDFREKKIRLIFLNSSMDSYSRCGFSPEQVQWLGEVLNSVEDGWDVATISHHNLLERHSTIQTPTRANEIINAIKNFKISKPNCKHIGHWFGHVHYDLVEVVDGITYIATDCDVIANGVADITIDGLTKPTKTNGTDTAYAIDIVCVDTINKRVNIKRFGAGSDRSFNY